MSRFLNLFFTFSLIKFRKEKEKKEKWIKLFPSQYPSVMKKMGEKKRRKDLVRQEYERVASHRRGKEKYRKKDKLINELKENLQGSTYLRTAIN